MKYSLEDLPHLEQEYDDNYNSSMEQFQTSLEAIDVLTQVYQKCQDLKNKPHISVEEFDNLKQYVEIGLGLETNDVSKLFPSLENHYDLRVSLEEFDDSVKGKLVHALNVGLDQIKGIGRFVRYSVNIINLLTKEYRQTNSKLNAVKDTTIKVRSNKYFCYDENRNCVNDTKEYIDQLKRSASLLTVVADSMGNYTKSSFLDNLKVLFGYLTLQKNDVLEGMFDNLYSLTNTITNHSEMKEVEHNREFDYKLYESDVMLGMYRASVTQMEKSKDPDGLSLRKKRNYASVMRLGVDNFISRDATDIPNSLEFTIDQNDVGRIRDVLLPLTNCYDRFNSNLLRLSLAEKLFNMFIMVIKMSTNVYTGDDARDVLASRRRSGGRSQEMQDRVDESVRRHEDRMRNMADDLFNQQKAKMDAQKDELLRKVGNLDAKKGGNKPRDIFSFDTMDEFNKWMNSPEDAIEGEFTRINPKMIDMQAIIPAGMILEGVLMMFFANYRIMMLTSGMIIGTNHTIFSLLRGHIKNAIEINKKLIAQQD